ncbi:thiamine pyrophosphate-binding protein [Parabacteroides bouchesdurhonensis]|uniref:thiamine pyrophosphate-binding protein n=1 Tax=Parabacteroides bouchesdurhonensis TaxID=1936995 RepID=UPI00164E406E|nr:thiamine pyrophosphate-binding protein [Parabacteroides bouchesdurhonensis]
MELTGAEILIQSFANHHVDTIFGYPGACVISILDSLYDNKDIRQILVRHEQGAVHAACGYAQLADKPGIVLVTSGPGATNTITGIADAYSSGIPLIIITGQVSSNLLGTDAFQESDMVSITAPITKWNCQIRKVDEISDTIDRAFNIATSDCPGPVLLDITKDAQTNFAQYISKSALISNNYSFANNQQPLYAQSQNPLYEKVLHALTESKKEIVLVIDKQPNDFYSEEYFCRNKVLKSDILGVAGFGLPAAIGATFAVSRKTICLVAGVLEFQATIKELGIIKQERLDIKIILLNNSTNNRFQIKNPDFTQIAGAYGIVAEKVDINSDLHSSIHKMLNTKESCILEIGNSI